MTYLQIDGYACLVSPKPSPSSAFDAQIIPRTNAQFRRQVKDGKHADPVTWALTRKLVHPSQIPSTLNRLTERIRHSTLPDALQNTLISSLGKSHVTPHQQVPVNHALLKELTGLPSTKAIRSLCLYFSLVQTVPTSSFPAPEDVEAFIRSGQSPYDLLLQVDQPSLLDLGAGDLSFEEDFLDLYLSRFQNGGKAFTLHAQDRLQPGSQFGGQYHANQERLDRLAHVAPEHLQFRFWGGIDMMEFSKQPQCLPQYTMVTCHAPATPTFAYEPTRISRPILHAHLTKMKGRYRKVRVNGEEALEVKHQGKCLTFPPWKFAIQGPLSLLNLVARRGAVGVLAAVDDEVFWEILAQLVDDPNMRPADVVFSPETLPDVFGHVHQALSSLKIGERCHLSDVIPLRRNISGGTTPLERKPVTHRFRFVEIRRGAVFPGMPASFTAHQFAHMSEEAPPWHLVLVPERVPTG